MNRIMVLMVLLLMATTALMGDMVFRVETEEPLLRSNRFDNVLPKTMNPGEPMIPYQDLRILLPQGVVFIEAEIEITRDNRTNVPFIDYAQEPRPISEKHNEQQLPPTTINRTIYERNAFYPYKDFEVLGVQRKNGYDILIVNVFPYHYNPVNGELTWAKEFTLTIRTENDSEVAYTQNLFLIDNTNIREELTNLVLNPQTIDSYRKDPVRRNPILPNPDEPHKMIIISHQNKEDIFEEFIEWKFSHGISTAFFNTNDIYANYEGVDNQERIRNFIIDAYQTYSQTNTPLQYVILGGDDNIIPIRGMYGRVGNYVDYHMPSDLYYSNLDGNWDANGNGIYGEEGDNVDWFAEVAIGRIPAFTDVQFQRFFAKTYYYVDQNSYSNDIAYMLGENLDHTPTWGGDYKDEIIPYLPGGYHIDTRYERDDTFSSQAVVDIFHSGLAIINHIGHANHNIVFGLSNSRISGLRNTEFGFAYTQGCYPAAFDFATSQESGCVGQNLTIAQGGLFAFIGNTRYGWYRRGTTDGPSQAFDRTFFAGLYNQNIRELGKTMNYSKESLVNQAMAQGVMRWIYYQLILFGDPSVAVKDPLGIYPYIEPVSVRFDDVEGDNDGKVNPGETIHIYVEIANLDNWADADHAEGTISINSDYITILNDTASFGYIPTNDSTSNLNSPFIIRLDPNIPYRTYQIQLKLEAFGMGDAFFSRNYPISLPVTLTQKHWPWTSEMPIAAAPISYDVNNDGTVEIIAVDIKGNINFLKDDTTPTLPQIKNDENLWRSTALGDITGNGIMDMVIASRRNKVKVFSTEGDTLFAYQDCGQVILTPVIADLNNDGLNQIIFLDIDKKLYVINNVGGIEPGFPITLSQTSVGDLAVADITGDGYQEIIIGSLSGSLYVIRYDGSMVANFPVELHNQIVTAPIVIHNYDIVVGTGDNKLFLISREGEILLEAVTPGRISMEVIAADFTGSNSLEFAYVTNNGYINIINRLGESLPGFPISINGSFLHPPLAADINGDGSINLIAYSSTGTIYGFNADGTNLNSLPFPLNISVNAPAILADIDNDGDVEIILPTSTGVSIVDYKYSYGLLEPWITYRGNQQRTGFYGEDPTLSVEEMIATPITALHQNYPNPFNPTTRIDFSLQEDTHTKLQIFNVKGQLVTTLVDDKMEVGRHTVVWQGVNDRQQSVGSGIYFYRLSTETDSIIKKMILVK